MSLIRPNYRFADDPPAIGKDYADLRDLSKEEPESDHSEIGPS